MRRPTLLLSLLLLLVPVAGLTAVGWWGSGSPWAERPGYPRPSASGGTLPASGERVSTAADAAEGVVDPNLPITIGETRRIAARAIDDTASAPTHQALINLARRFLGKPYNAFSLDRLRSERLLLDLTRFDCFLFVEQLLALVNSRQVDTQTAGVDRFSDHVRQLRYDGGEVAYCRRHHYFTRWADAAEKQGYLVNLNPFLPGSRSRNRPLTFLSQHVEAYEPMKLAANRACITALEKDLTVTQGYVPLTALTRLLPSLRSGDIFALVTAVPGLDVTHVGLVEVEGGQVGAIHAAPGEGVMRSDDLTRYAWGVADVIGVAFYRPIPNPEGKPGG